MHRAKICLLHPVEVVVDSSDQRRKREEFNKWRSGSQEAKQNSGLGLPAAQSSCDRVVQTRNEHGDISPLRSRTRTLCSSGAYFAYVKVHAVNSWSPRLRYVFLVKSKQCQLVSAALFILLSSPKLGCALRIRAARTSFSMATRGLKFSSPVRANQDDSLITISSSPELPSLGDLLEQSRKKNPLRSGSHAAPIPATATTTFTSAADLYRSTQAPDISTTTPLESRQPTKSPRKPPATKRARRKTVTASIPGAQELIEDESAPVMTSKPRSRKKKIKEIAVEEPPRSPAEKPWLVFKSAPGVPPGDAADSSKAVEEPATKTRRTKKTTETVSRHFKSASKKEEPEASPSLVILEEPIDLEPAIKRRTDWTPSKDTALHTLGDVSDIIEISSPTFNEENLSRKRNAEMFKNLADTFGCKPDSGREPSQPPPAQGADVLGKRKLVEMVATHDTKVSFEVPEISPTKAKAPKKKARTITELATAAYRIDEQNQESGTDGDSLLRFFNPAEDCTPLPPTDGAKSKAKAPRKGASSKGTKKKKEPPKRVLLSPTSAMRQVSNQDIVFGTASQLATEDDPQLLRALHAAMQSSNSRLDNPFASSSPPQSDLWARSRSANRLWKAGTRDIAGELVDLDIVDLANSPSDIANPRVLASEAGKASNLPSTMDATEVSKEAAPFDNEILDLTSSPAITGAREPSSRQTPAERSVKTTSLLASVHVQQSMVGVTNTVDLELPASNQEQGQMDMSQRVAPETTAEAAPKYELFTDAQLAKEIHSYGFKSIKKRSAMIALLEQCWASKSGSAVQGIMPTTATTVSNDRPAVANSAPSTSTEARPKGRPKKDAIPAGPPAASVGQQASSPKKPRGRPRKDAENPPAVGRPALKGQSSASQVTQAQSKVPDLSTPKRRKDASGQSSRFLTPTPIRCPCLHRKKM